MLARLENLRIFACLNSECFPYHHTFPNFYSISTHCTFHWVVHPRNFIIHFLKWQTFVSYSFLNNIIFVHETSQRDWNLTKLYLKSGSIISIVTCHGLDCPETKSWSGRGLLHLCGPVLRPTQPPVQLVLGLFPGGKADRAWHWPPTPSGIKVKERVELYFCSTSEPSWLVLRWTLLSLCKRWGRKYQKCETLWCAWAHLLCMTVFEGFVSLEHKDLGTFHTTYLINFFD